MNRLANVGVGDRVRLYGQRFATGAIEGVVVREKDRMFDVVLDDPQAPKALLYDSVGSTHAVVWGVVHYLTSVERLEVAA